jgi:hypothetical protein
MWPPWSLVSTSPPSHAETLEKFGSDRRHTMRRIEKLRRDWEKIGFRDERGTRIGGSLPTAAVVP